MKVTRLSLADHYQVLQTIKTETNCLKKAGIFFPLAEYCLAYTAILKESCSNAKQHFNEHVTARGNLKAVHGPENLNVSNVKYSYFGYLSMSKL